nr:uncharacterized protein LOC110370667 [Helicoverpa armigera]
MQKKRSARSASAMSQKSDVQVPANMDVPPSDCLVLKVMSLRLPDQDPKHFAIKVTFFDQLLVHAIIKSIGARDEESSNSIANGTLTYDPSDYEKMSLYADCPLVVHIQPLRNIDTSKSSAYHLEQSVINPTKTRNISCCNIDILSIFLGMEDQQKMCIKKRMEPMVEPSMMHRKSWDTLPLLTLELTAERDASNITHHKVLRDANWMKVTLVACYNMFIPFEKDYVYTAASKLPSYSDDNEASLITFSQGYREPRRFNCTNFYPKWESLRSAGEVFTQSDQKLQCNLKELKNEDNIDLQHYLNKVLPYHTAVWGSFHRTLMLKDKDAWLWNHLRCHKWPFEMHIYGDSGGYSFMAFLNLFQLLFPGEQIIRLVVPLHWVHPVLMMRECGCDLLLTPNDRPPSGINERIPSPSPALPRASKSSRVVTDSSVGTSVSTITTVQMKATGADDNDAFIIVEVRLAKPLKSVAKVPRILKDEISGMLVEMEKDGPKSRKCTGRGQLETDWQKTVKSAVNSLRKVPYYGTTEFCTFNRQLSETRTRVELTTSCWQDAATFINNNFVVQQYLHSDDVFEELVMMAQACLMKSACAVLLGPDKNREVDPAVRAARHARQMQDINHALELFFKLVVEEPRNADHWREVSTCLKDVDRDWANVCLNKAVVLNPRHPLSLLSKAAMLFEENPLAAEPFFMALLAFCPVWSTVWAVTSVYFYERQLYHVADVIMKCAEKVRAERSPEEKRFPRTWGRELGDWYDSTPLLPGMSLYYDAADLLLRLRAIPLAEVCMSRILSAHGETAPYYHLIALSCRLRGNYEEAMCHLNIAFTKFGEINYLRTLEAECQHRLGNIDKAIESFGKAGCCNGAFSILMSVACGDNQKSRAILLDLVRRQKSAYAWTALAEDWLNSITDMSETDLKDSSKMSSQQLNAKCCAISSAIQALKMDRRAGKAWAILGKMVNPCARRLYCLQMASMCGWDVTDKDVKKASLPSKYSLCFGVNTSIGECRCSMCDRTHL